MLRNYMGIINLEEKETDIRSLTNYRPIGTIPIAGRYRVIDFMMSNLVNAGITHVSVFANKSTRSLIDHLGSGRPWDLDRKIDGLFVFNHSILGVTNADAKLFGSNMEFLNSSKYENVILASSYMICNLDFEAVAEYHEASGADITLVYKPIENAESNFLNCDTIKTGKDSRVVNVSKNIGIEKKANICMEIFLMKKKILTELMYKAMSDGIRHNFKNLIYNNILAYNVKAYEFGGYVQCINSVDNYYKTNMDMLELEVVGELFSKARPVITKTKDSPPTQYVAGSQVHRSILADGSMIKGKVTDSVICRSVRIEEGAEVDGCVILQNAIIRKGAKLSNVIVDKGVSVDEDVVVQCPKQYPLVFEKKKYFASVD